MALKPDGSFKTELSDILARKAAEKRLPFFFQRPVLSQTGEKTSIPTGNYKGSKVFSTNQKNPFAISFPFFMFPYLSMAVGSLSGGAMYNTLSGDFLSLDDSSTSNETPIVTPSIDPLDIASIPQTVLLVVNKPALVDWRTLSVSAVPKQISNKIYFDAENSRIAFKYWNQKVTDPNPADAIEAFGILFFDKTPPWIIGSLGLQQINGVWHSNWIQLSTSLFPEWDENASSASVLMMISWLA